MKEPKTFRYPRLYVRAYKKRNGYPEGYYFRIRIIFPDGSATYSTAVEFIDWEHPCWNRKLYESPFSQIKKMKAFDKMLGYKTIFLGEIK